MLEFACFLDESYISENRFRVVSMLSLKLDPETGYEPYAQAIQGCFKDKQNGGEFKWVELKNRANASWTKETIDCLFAWIKQGNAKMDVIIWDTQDTRHDVFGRDDKKNQGIMSYHLINNVCSQRWPQGSSYSFFYDKMEKKGGLDLKTLDDCVRNRGKQWVYFKLTKNNMNSPLESLPESKKQYYSVKCFEPVDSKEYVLIQVADLFAGLGGYFPNDNETKDLYKKYELYIESISEQQSLIPQDKPELTNTEEPRFEVVKHLKDRAKKEKVDVDLILNFINKNKKEKIGKKKTYKSKKSSKSKADLFIDEEEKIGKQKTYKPRSPINFWHYTPQSPKDKASTKQKKQKTKNKTKQTKKG